MVETGEPVPVKCVHCNRSDAATPEDVGRGVFKCSSCGEVSQCMALPPSFVAFGRGPCVVCGEAATLDKVKHACVQCWRVYRLLRWPL